MPENNKEQPLFYRGSYQAAKKVEWIWYPYIPAGRITLVNGDPGDGKSTFMLNIASLLTKGKPMPDGYACPLSPCDVIYQCREDNYADTTRPRLDRAGADIERIIIINDYDGSLATSDARVEETIKQTGAKLCIFDPIQEYLEKPSNMMQAGQVRRALTNLILIARKYNCAIVFICHMNKRNVGNSLYRVLGSIDLVGLAKSILMVRQDPYDEDVRIVTHEKAATVKKGKPFAFRLNNLGLTWDMDYDGNKEIESPPMFWAEQTNEISQKPDPITIITDLLSDGPVPSADVKQALLDSGISERTIYNIKKELGVESFKIDNIWHMRLPK